MKDRNVWVFWVLILCLALILTACSFISVQIGVGTGKTNVQKTVSPDIDREVD